MRLPQKSEFQSVLLFDNELIIKEHVKHQCLDNVPLRADSLKSNETHLVEVLIREKAKKSSDKVFAGHELLAFDFTRCIFAEDFTQFVC